MITMIDYINKNLIQQVFHSNEFKGWLLSKRWFGDKSILSSLEFDVEIDHFEIISQRIILSTIKITTKDPGYLKEYFLPLIYYKKIQEILETSENDTKNVLRLTDSTFSKKQVLLVGGEHKIYTLNLVEAEFCLLFWKKMLFDKKISEKFPSLGLELDLYTEQFEDESSMNKVQTLIEASLYPDRYSLSLKQLGKGNTTNSLFLLNIVNERSENKTPTSYVLKSYKVYSESLEPAKLFVLVKNSFPNTPKIYGTIKLGGKISIGIIESVSHVGNLGEIYWNELNELIKNTFKDMRDDYSDYEQKVEISKLIKKYCIETLEVSEKIGGYIKRLHSSLISSEDASYSLESVNSESYLKTYTEKITGMITDLQNIMSQKPKTAFYNLPKISSIFIDIIDITEKLQTQYTDSKIDIQPVHQDLHMEQILYQKENNDFNFYFLDFEGDPQLSIEEKKDKYPIEKDLSSFLRSLSYIKFNTLLLFIEKKIIQPDSFEVPEEVLYNMFFRRAGRAVDKNLDIVLNILNTWELRLIGKFLKSMEPSIPLLNFYYIERVLHEIKYEILFRPEKIIVPILGLKEITERT